MPGDTHQRLREATRAEHQRLEDGLDILGRLARPDGRRDVVARFHDFHAALEAAAAPWLADLPDLDFEARRRTPLLRRDLAALGVDLDPARPRDVPAPASIAEALGLLYVLEGSALGGRVIRRAVEAAGGDLTGLSHVDPYGERIGERWRSFLSVLERRTATSAQAQAAVDGAVSGFRFAAASLHREPAHG